MVRSDSFSNAPAPPSGAALVVGAGQRVLQANAAASELFGLPADSLRGLSMEQLVPTERRGELQNLTQVLAGGSSRRLRTIVRTADGRRVEVSATIDPVTDDRGHVTAVNIRYEPTRNSNRWVRSSMPPGAHGPGESMPQRPISERRLVASGFVAATQERLGELDQQLAWLEQALGSQSTADLSQPQVRSRILLHIAEARALTHACRADLAREAQVSGQEVPAPPKVPEL